VKRFGAPQARRPASASIGEKQTGDTDAHLVISISVRNRCFAASSRANSGRSFFAATRMSFHWARYTSLGTGREKVGKGKRKCQITCHASAEKTFCFRHTRLAIRSVGAHGGNTVHNNPRVHEKQGGTQKEYAQRVAHVGCRVPRPATGVRTDGPPKAHPARVDTGTPTGTTLTPPCTGTRHSTLTRRSPARCTFGILCSCRAPPMTAEACGGGGGARRGREGEGGRG
jgi:hypothetical protein